MGRTTNSSSHASLKQIFPCVFYHSQLSSPQQTIQSLLLRPQLQLQNQSVHIFHASQMPLSPQNVAIRYNSRHQTSSLTLNTQNIKNISHAFIQNPSRQRSQHTNANLRINLLKSKKITSIIFFLSTRQPADSSSLFSSFTMQTHAV